ncbi:MAG: phosphatase [Actinomycetota bacterium]|nr:phosphatase [Actinomycetota bacterium]
MSDLREHLIEARLAGSVATTPGNTVANCEKLVAGKPDYTFGLSDWRSVDVAEVRAVVSGLFGAAAVDGDPDGPGWIDPDATLAAIEGHRAKVADHARARSRVLLATGHPTGLLPHYMTLGRALLDAGCDLLTALDNSWLVEVPERRGLRFLGRVACAWTGGDLIHTHRSHYMEAMLDALDEEGRWPDLVLGDHGMAGAAIERGIETLGIADVNDPALFLAQARGRTESVMPIDDNLAPRLFEPVTTAILDGVTVTAPAKLPAW